MDTILYLYKKKGLKEPELEPVGLKTHMLIRIAVDVQKEEWFGIRLGEQREREKQTEQSEQGAKSGPAERKMPQRAEPSEISVLPFLRRLMRKRQEQKRKKAEEQGRQRQAALEEERIRAVEDSLRKLVSEIRELAGGPEECFCVYEDGVRRWLIREEEPGIAAFGDSEKPARREQILPSLWEKYFRAEEFRAWQDRFWVDLLLTRAESEHYVILGTAPCLFSLIEDCARGMKSLSWFLQETEYSEEIGEFIEDFYTEYGLAIILRTLEGPAAWRKLVLVCGQPVNVLDFTGEAKIPVSGVCGGSVWLDMLSVEEKQRRIAAQGRGIAYFSLKEYWKRAQKRCNCPILP